MLLHSGFDGLFPGESIGPQPILIVLIFVSIKFRTFAAFYFINNCCRRAENICHMAVLSLRYSERGPAPAALSSPGSTIEMQSLRSPPRPARSDSADPQVVCMHANIREVLF